MKNQKLNTKMDYLRSNKFAKDTVDVMLDDMKDLETWSVYNDDKYQDEILELKERVENLKQCLKMKK